jgi:hypothetical protein
MSPVKGQANPFCRSSLETPIPESDASADTSVAWIDDKLFDRVKMPWNGLIDFFFLDDTTSIRLKPAPTIRRIDHEKSKTSIQPCD